jgi:hypothetical protein
MASEIAFRLLQLAGTVLTLVLAWRSFERRFITLGDEPTLPRYFAPRSQYGLGTITYAAIMALLYLMLVSVWMPLRPLMEVLFDNAASDPASYLASITAALVVPLIITVLFFVVISWESRLNPVLVLRDVIYNLFAIPSRVQEVYTALRAAGLEGVDDARREQCMAHLLADSLDLDDFDKSDDTLEYRWARACLLFDQIQSYADRPSYRRFFMEPSLKWGQICILFNETSEKIANWKGAEPHYTKTLQLIEKLDQLIEWLCRLLACIVVYGSPGEKELWQSVASLGGDQRRVRLRHTYRYLLVFTASIVLAVMIGRELSVTLYNVLFSPEQMLGHFDFATIRWSLFAVSMYVLPVAVVFIAHIEAYRSPRNPARYYGFYVLMTTICFVISTSMSALIFGLSADDTQFSFAASFVGSMRFGLLPALMCGYIAWQMDSPADDEEQWGDVIRFALLRGVSWWVIGLIIMLYATDEIPLESEGLRFTMTLTSAFVSAFLGVAARFRLESAVRVPVTGTPPEGEEAAS